MLSLEPKSTVILFFIANQPRTFAIYSRIFHIFHLFTPFTRVIDFQQISPANAGICKQGTKHGIIRRIYVPFSAALTTQNR